MPHINLMPWREARRKERERRFYLSLLGGAAIAGLIVYGVHYAIEQQKAYQKERNDYLSQQISKLDRQIKEIQSLQETRDRLLARMEVIQELQHTRPLIVHLFQEITETVPAGIRLSSIKREGNQITFTGHGESAGRVADFLRHLDAAEHLSNPQLIGEGIKAVDDRTDLGLYGFTINAKLVQKNGEENEEGAAS